MQNIERHTFIIENGNYTSTSQCIILDFFTILYIYPVWQFPVYIYIYIGLKNLIRNTALATNWFFFLQKNKQTIQYIKT